MSMTTPALPTYPTRIDIPGDTRATLLVLLNKTLATTLDLKTHTKQAHWNIKGLQFIALHELFDDMASEVEEYVDMVAERVTALGGTAMGTAAVAAKDSLLQPYPTEISDAVAHLTALADRYGVYAKHVREASTKASELGDDSTADLYTEISRGIDKRLWFLEAHLVNV